MLANRYPMIATLLACNLLASWTHWQWLAKRANDGSDDPWGVVALLTLVALVWLDRAELCLPNQRSLSITALLTALACISWGVLPPMPATALALLAITCLLSGMLPVRRTLTPLLTLSLLALPLAASLNFYLGYPLRWFCAQATAMALSVLGLTVTPQGAALWWNGQSILIDAPCAGVAMLWIGLYLAALFSYIHAAGALRSVVNLALASVIVVLANVLRNTLLFYKESGIVYLPHWTHEAIGLLIFGLIVPLIYQATVLNPRRAI